MADKSTTPNNTLRVELDEALSTELSPEVIDTYAEDAIRNLIRIATKATDSFVAEIGMRPKSYRALEDDAFEYYGLGDVEGILDYLSSKAEEVEKLDALIDSIPEVDQVIIPPGLGEGPVRGDGVFEEKGEIPRLKTLLFVLSNAFDLDVYEHKEVSVQRGAVPLASMRKSGYYSVVVPSLERLILVCDEAENATYIFSTTALEGNGLTLDEVRSLNKDGLRGLIAMSPGIGTRIEYSKNFVARIDQALRDLGAASHNKSQNSRTSTAYLYPKAPDGVLSINGLAKGLEGVTRAIALKAAEELGGSLGPVATYRFHTMLGPGYTPDQQQMIIDHLKATGWMDASPPEDVVTVSHMTSSWNTSATAIKRAIATLGERLGEADTYVFSGHRTKGYTAVQQKMIRDLLESQGKLVDSAPEDVKSVAAMSSDLGLGGPTIQAAIDEIGEELGEVKSYKFTTARALGYTPEQQRKILSKLNELGRITGAAPEGFYSIPGFAKSLGIGSKLVADELDEDDLKGILGETKTYTFGRSRRAIGLSPEQQEIIRQRLESKGLLVDTAPDGVLAANGMAKRMRIEQTAVYDAVESIGEGLGEVKRYKFAGVITEGYTPAQQAAIEGYLRSTGYVDDAPEGVESAKSLAKSLGVSDATVRKAAEKLKAELGELTVYRYASRKTIGYSAEQQRIISSYLRSRGIIS